MKFLELIIKLFPAICHLLRAVTGRKPNRGTVLIVEDNANDAQILEHALRKIGYDCQVASSGEMAKGILQNAFFSVVFLDLRLPGMSGAELLRLLSNGSPDARIVVVCGEPSDVRAIDEGKPIIVIRKAVSVAGLMELFKMLKVE